MAPGAKVKLGGCAVSWNIAALIVTANEAVSVSVPLVPETVNVALPMAAAVEAERVTDWEPPATIE